MDYKYTVEFIKFSARNKPSTQIQLSGEIDFNN